jgi:uncharacterized protein YjiS (DUF1127 family)
MLRKFFRWIATALLERRAYNELRQLDDRMLRDIGLDRGRLGGH